MKKIEKRPFKSFGFFYAIIVEMLSRTANLSISSICKHSGTCNVVHKISNLEFKPVELNYPH